MHLVSTFNPLCKSEGNVPVALFVFEDQRRFLRVSEDYEDTIYAVGRAFKIDDDDMNLISLSTSSLDICKGVLVVIDRDAYPLMWTVLDEVIVKVEGTLVAVVGHGDPKRSITLGATTRAPRTTLTPGPSRRPSHTELRQATILTSQTQYAPVDETRGEPTGTRTLDAGKEIREPSPVKLVEAPALSLIRSYPEEDRLGMGNPSDHDEGFSSEDKSTNKGRTAKGRASTPNPNFGFPPPQAISSTTTVNQPNMRGKERSNKVSPELGNSSDESPHKCIPTSQRSPRDDEPEAVPQFQPTTDDADPRFEISIIGPEPNQSAHFKTRGKHPVRKVLQAACRTFEVDYDRSRLILAVSVEEGDRELTHKFECAVDDTVTKCGINSESRLFLWVDEPESDEYE